MSEEEFGYGSDEWPEQNSDNEEDVAIDNAFYQAEELMQSSPEEAIEMFKQVVELESKLPIGERNRTFKSLENLVVQSARIQNYSQIHQFHQQLLEMTKQTQLVTSNDARNAINKILDVASELQDESTAVKIYEATLSCLGEGQEKLWFNTNLKLGKLYMNKRSFQEVQSTIIRLQSSCKLEDGSDDPKKSQGLLETYALEIELCDLTSNFKRMKEVYNKSQQLTAAVSDPRIMGVLKESGGKMMMSEKLWNEAFSEFFEAFKNYQEAGNPRAKTILKYVVLASILSNSHINPFHSQEANVYREDFEIIAMINLRNAYENNDINEIQSLIKNPQNKILSDHYIQSHLEELLRSVRLQILQKRIRAYRSVAIDYLAKSLNISSAECNSLLCELIVEDKIQGRIDAVKGYLELNPKESNSLLAGRYRALYKWEESLRTLQNNLVERVKI